MPWLSHCWELRSSVSSLHLQFPARCIFILNLAVGCPISTVPKPVWLPLLLLVREDILMPKGSSEWWRLTLGDWYWPLMPPVKPLSRRSSISIQLNKQKAIMLEEEWCFYISTCHREEEGMALNSEHPVGIWTTTCKCGARQEKLTHCYSSVFFCLLEGRKDLLKKRNQINNQKQKNTQEGQKR